MALHYGNHNSRNCNLTVQENIRRHFKANCICIKDLSHTSLMKQRAKLFCHICWNVLGRNSSCEAVRTILLTISRGRNNQINRPLFLKHSSLSCKPAIQRKSSKRQGKVSLQFSPSCLFFSFPSPNMTI